MYKQFRKNCKRKNLTHKIYINLHEHSKLIKIPNLFSKDLVPISCCVSISKYTKYIQSSNEMKLLTIFISERENSRKIIKNVCKKPKVIE